MLDRLRTKIFKEKINGKTIFVGGLEDHVEDKRDFRYTDLGGWFDYQPKARIKELTPIAIKDQGFTNTCVWQSYAATREAQEKIELSSKSIIRYAVKAGYIRGNGFSTLREGQRAGIEFGIADATLLDSNPEPWRSYAYDRLSEQVEMDAALHRGKSYFGVRSKNETLKALDDGFAIHTGIQWRTAYNMSGGFCAPWILRWGVGSLIGGHALALIGYDLDKGLYKFQNSFGEDYGEKGCFYIPMNIWHKVAPQGYVTVDLDGDTLTAFIERYNGKDVKKDGETAIYHVQNGTLRAYPDALTFHVFGGSFEPSSYEVVASRLFELMNIGESMKAEESHYWPRFSPIWQELKWGDEKVSIQTIKNMLDKQHTYE